MAINPPPLTPKMKSKFGPLIIMASLAVVLGLVAAGGVWQYLSQTQKKVQELSVTRAVVVAAKQITAGAKLAETDLAIKQLPAQAVPKDYPSSIESLKGRIVKGTIQPEEIITESRLLAEGAAGGLPVVIPAGHRAITIKVNEVVGVGGFINPGDRIDIVSILKRSENQTFSKTILQNVLILAVGDKIFDINALADPQPKLVTQVTLALTPIDSEKLALAADVGQLHLSLRPHGDTKISETEGARLEDVYGYLAYTPDPNSGQLPIIAPADTKSNKNSIEIILGNQRTYFYY